MRFVFGVITFAVLAVVFLLVLGWQISTPRVVPPPRPPAETTTCPPTVTAPAPPPVTVTVTASPAAWLRRGTPCPGAAGPSF